MARASRHTKLDTRTARLKLKPSRYAIEISSGLSLLYRRPVKGNGTWFARITNDAGKEIYPRLADADDYIDSDGDNVLTYPQAQAKARQLYAEARATPGGKPVTVKEAVVPYLKWFKEHRRSARETEATINAHILPAWGDTLLCDITAPALRRWHEGLASQPARKRTGKKSTEQAHREGPVTEDQKRARKSTANRILTVFKAILNRAFHDELVGDDKAWRRVKPFPNADEPIIRFLTNDEAVRLVNACHPDFRPLIKAALFTGARYGELTRLKVADVNVDTGLVYINAEAKSGKGRYIPLSADGLDFFQTAIVGKPGTAFCFSRGDGAQWGQNHHVRLLKAACEQAKIEPAITFHDLRHSYASLLAQAGADLLTISKLLGHADTRVTSRHYAHLCDRTLSDTVKRLLPSFGHKSDTKVTSITGGKK